MADANPTAKAQAEIPYGIIEYTATFKNPILEAWSNPAGLIRAVLSALDSFGFKLEGVEYKIQAEKINERAIVFRRTPPGAVLTVGPGKLLISAENLDWSEAERFISGMNAAMSAIHEVSKYEIASQQLALGMHVQFKAKTQTDVSAPLLNPMALKLMDGEVKSYGIILNRITRQNHVADIEESRPRPACVLVAVCCLCANVRAGRFHFPRQRILRLLFHLHLQLGELCGVSLFQSL